MKKFLAFAAGMLLATSAFAQSNTEFPLTQPGPPGQQSVWVQGGTASNVRTYRFAEDAGTWATSGEFLQIQGSATKTVRINKIIVTGFATAAVGTPILVKRESAAISGGTCAAQAANFGVMDTANTVGSATAAISLCSAAPTAGTAVSTIETCRLLVQIAASGLPDVCVFSFGTNNGQPLRLTGTSDFVGVSNTTSFGTGGVVDVTVEWVEEP